MRKYAGDGHGTATLFPRMWLCQWVAHKYWLVNVNLRKTDFVIESEFLASSYQEGAWSRKWFKNDECNASSLEKDFGLMCNEAQLYDVFANDTETVTINDNNETN